MNGSIKQVLAGAALDVLANTPPDDSALKLEALESEIEALENQLRGLIRQQARAPESDWGLYQDEINVTSDRRRILLASLDSAMRADRQTDRRLQHMAIDELRRVGADEFWKLPNGRQHQLLHLLLGDYRLAVDNGEIVGLILRPGKRKPVDKPPK